MDSRRWSTHQGIFFDSVSYYACPDEIENEELGIACNRLLSVPLVT